MLLVHVQQNDGGARYKGVRHQSGEIHAYTISQTFVEDRGNERKPATIAIAILNHFLLADNRFARLPRELQRKPATKIVSPAAGIGGQGNAAPGRSRESSTAAMEKLVGDETRGGADQIGEDVVVSFQGRVALARVQG